MEGPGGCFSSNEQKCLSSMRWLDRLVLNVALCSSASGATLVAQTTAPNVKIDCESV